jgi:hypothetical protein
VSGRIILKRILSKYCTKVCTGFDSPGIVASCEHGHEHPGSVKGGNLLAS